MKHVYAPAGWLLTAVSAALPALGDGAFLYYDYEQTAATDLAQTRQEVLLAFYKGADDGEPRVTYVIRTRYAGQPTAFAWIVPVPATPTDVTAHPSGELFDALSELTKPMFTIASRGDKGGIGCGCSADGTALLESGLVEVEASGQAGIFEWTALTSTGATALLTWLNAHGFAVPSAAAAVLDHYIQSDMHFLALRVSEPENVAADSTGVVELPPIQFTCQTTQRFYPMAISQVSAAPETEVLVYVLANHRAEGANVSNAVIDPQAVVYDPNSASQTNYETLFSQTIARSGGLALVTEFAGYPYDWMQAADRETVPVLVTQAESAARDYPAVVRESLPAEVLDLLFITRMRTVIVRERMSQDFFFQDAASDEEVYSHFSVRMTAADALAGAAGAPLAAVLTYGVFHVGMKQRARRARSSGCHFSVSSADR